MRRRLPRHVGQPVERHGVADEAAVDEDARQRGLVGRVEAQLDALLAEIGAHLEEAAAPAHGAVLADECGPRGGGTPRRVDMPRGTRRIRSASASRCSRGARSVVSCSRAWYSAPSQAQCLALSSASGSGVVGQLVADLLAPRPVPSLDHALGLGVLHAGVEQVNPELGADEPERVGDVGRAAIDVVGAREAVLEDGLLEPVLLRPRRPPRARSSCARCSAWRRRSARAGSSCGVCPSGAITSGPCSASPTHRSPACSAMKLRRSADGPAQRARGDARELEQAVHARARQLPRLHPPGPLQHPDDAA